MQSSNRITVSSLLHEAWHTISHVEQGLQTTMVSLATAPGKMIKKYLSGDRYGFQKPFAFLFIATTVYAILLHFLQSAPEVNHQGASTHERFIANADFIESKYYSWLHMGFLPVYGFISFILFRRQRYNYAEWMVVCCYLLSFILFLLIPYQIINYFFDFSNAANFWIQMLIVILYSVFALSGFLSIKNLWSKTALSIVWAAAIFTFYMYMVQGIAWLMTLRN
jgi:hypothetical protein